MGAVDVERQAQRLPHEAAGRRRSAGHLRRGTLKDAMNEALRDWVTNVEDTFYCIGTVAGPHPYPAMVRDFQSIIGNRSARADAEGRGPPARLAGRLHRRRLQRHGPVPSLPRRQGVRIIGVEAGGKGSTTDEHAPPDRRPPGVLHGNRTYLLQDDDGQILEGHSISAGLDYPGIGPSIPGCTTPAASNMCRSPTRRRWTPSSSAASWKASSRRWSRATRWPM
jgi:tryptophan synthase beta chain